MNTNTGPRSHETRNPIHPTSRSVRHTGRVLLDLLGITDQDITALTLQCKAGELPSLTLERTLTQAFVNQGPFRFRVVAEDGEEENIDLESKYSPLDLDAMQAQAQQRVQEWIDEEAAKLSKASYRWFVVTVSERVIRDLAYTQVRKLAPLFSGMRLGGAVATTFGTGIGIGGFMGAAA